MMRTFLALKNWLCLAMILFKISDVESVGNTDRRQTPIKRINKVRKRDCPLKNSNDLFAHKENATAIHPSSSGKNSPQQCQKDDSIFDDDAHKP